jgi:hypothetical protein
MWLKFGVSIALGRLAPSALCRCLTLCFGASSGYSGEVPGQDEILPGTPELKLERLSSRANCQLFLP